MKTFLEFVKAKANEGVLSLPEDLSRYTNLLMKSIQQACVPQYWQEGFAVLLENKVVLSNDNRFPNLPQPNPSPPLLAQPSRLFILQSLDS